MSTINLLKRQRKMKLYQSLNEYFRKLIQRGIWDLFGSTFLRVKFQIFKTSKLCAWIMAFSNCKMYKFLLIPISYSLVFSIDQLVDCIVYSHTYKQYRLVTTSRCTVYVKAHFHSRKISTDRNFPKISLLIKLNIFNFEFFSNEKFVSVNHILQNFLSTENVPERKWAFTTATETPVARKSLK
jgi:hypothetical protein